MRTVKAKIYDDDGETVRTEDVHVSFTHGEPHPQNRVIAIEFVKPDKDGLYTGIYISLKTLEKACGLKISRRRRNS